MMSFILYIIVGGALGYAASILFKVSDSQGMLANVGLGILGNFLGSALFGNIGPCLWGYSILPALICTILLVWGYNQFFNKK